MRALLLIVALATGCADGCTVVGGKVSIGGNVTVGSTVPPLTLFRAATGIPNQTGCARVNDSVFVRPWYVPTDVTSVTLRVGNRYRNGGEGNSVASNVAVYKSDGAGLPTGSAFAVFSSQTIPGDGSMLTLGPTSIVRGVDGKIVILFSLPASVPVSCVDNQIYGCLYDVTTQVSPPPALGCGAAPLISLWWELEYSTRRPRFNVFGDSISLGSAGAAIPGLESSAFYRLGVDHDYAIAQWGANASTVDDLNSDANFTSDIIWNGAGWILEGGTNDFGAGATAAQLETRVTTLNTTLSGLTSGHRFIMTVAPRAFTGAQETDRTTYNTWVRANSLAFTAVGDPAALQNVGGLADNTTPSTLFGPFSADGLHWSAAGHVQEEAQIAAITP